MMTRFGRVTLPIVSGARRCGYGAGDAGVVGAAGVAGVGVDMGPSQDARVSPSGASGRVRRAAEPAVPNVTGGRRACRTGCRRSTTHAWSGGGSVWGAARVVPVAIPTEIRVWDGGFRVGLPSDLRISDVWAGGRWPGAGVGNRWRGSGPAARATGGRRAPDGEPAARARTAQRGPAEWLDPSER